MKKVVILGGYGNFGKRIVESLAKTEKVTLYVAGRNRDKAMAFIDSLCNNGSNQDIKATLSPCVIDIFAEDFAEQLETLAPFLVIHTSGPFQGQDYRVPHACINAGAHYIDLADDRRFVCDISQLDELAHANKVLAVSGASSVPGLSSTVIENFQHLFQTIDTIDLSIAPGNKAERGLATVKAILSYTGHAITVFRDGRWQEVYGWMDSKINDFGGYVGKRHLANVDVPDLAIFPEKYNVTERVTFQAGLELPILHNTMLGMAYLVKSGLVKNWAPLAKTIVGTSNLFLPFGTDKGAMEVFIQGRNQANAPESVKWTLYAPKGNGPYIPTLSTIILAKKLLNSGINEFGAKPCVGLFNLSDFDAYFQTLDITNEVQVSGQ